MADMKDRHATTRRTWTYDMSALEWQKEQLMEALYAGTLSSAYVGC